MFTLKKSCLFIALPVLFIATASAGHLKIKDNRIPGGVAVLNIKSTLKNPTASFKNIEPLLKHIQKKHWQIILPLPINVKVGQHTMTVRDDTKTLHIPFRIQKHHYQEQRIQIKNKKLVTPPQSSIERIIKERKIIDHALNTKNTLIEQPFAGFSWPVQGPITSQYGLKRFYNNIPKSPHKGMDIAAKKGTTIVAPADGVVRITGDFYYNGLSVIVEHADNIKTLYSHLSKIDVKNGQKVLHGEKIGEIGNTGRSTAPHLHWGTYLNGVAIDPMNLLKPSVLKNTTR